MKKGTTGHPKTKALARQLGISLPTAIGTLQLLWEFASEYAPDGAIGKFSDGYIAEECGWSGDPEDLIRALTAQECRWVDCDPLFRLIVHDWPDHCEDSVHNKLARGHKFFANGSAPKLSRLSKPEREATESFYKENPYASARHALLSARDERTEQAHGERTPQAHVPCAPTLPCPATTLPLPPPRAAVAVFPSMNSEYPKTHAAMAGKYPTVDAKFVQRVVMASVQAYVSVDKPLTPAPTDQDIADAVNQAHSESTNQKGPALFLTTVPQVILNYALRGRHPPSDPRGPNSLGGYKELR